MPTKETPLDKGKADARGVFLFRLSLVRVNKAQTRKVIGAAAVATDQITFTSARGIKPTPQIIDGRNDIQSVDTANLYFASTRSELPLSRP
ncbi:MAG: hypothetical protein ABIP97_03650 [Chthoniobacterales bacterium]